MRRGVCFRVDGAGRGEVGAAAGVLGNVVGDVTDDGVVRAFLRGGILAFKNRAPAVLCSFEAGNGR